MNRPVRAATPATFSLQDAKARFSKVVTAAMQGRAQHVTRRGKPAVVIVGAEEFDRMSRAAGATTPSFIEHLLAIPKSRKADAPFELPRLDVKPRDVDF